jgi:hypothetical protein
MNHGDTHTHLQHTTDVTNYLQMAKSSYAITSGLEPDSQIGPFKLIEKTPTDLCYYSGDTFVIVVRGTNPSDPKDLKADALIAVNGLRSSSRFQNDLETLLSWKQRYHGTWIGVGHSLGGAICDEFILMGLITEAFTFNPAVQPANFKANIPNYRVYSHGDPLYLLFGKHTDSHKLAGEETSLGQELRDLLKNHYLESFTDFAKDIE